MPNFDRSVEQVIDDMAARLNEGIRVEPTAYVVSALPEEGPDHDLFEIRVEYRGGGRWWVRHHGKSLGADGQWEYRPADEDERDEWMATHRFTLPTALRLARDAAPHITVNGRNVQDVLTGATEPSGRGRRDG